MLFSLLFPWRVTRESLRKHYTTYCSTWMLMENGALSCMCWHDICRPALCVCSVMSSSFRAHGLSPPGFSGRGIFQARTLEWVAISYSRRSSWPGNWTHVSCVPSTGRKILYHHVGSKSCVSLIQSIKYLWCAYYVPLFKHWECIRK